MTLLHSRGHNEKPTADQNWISSENTNSSGVFILFWIVFMHVVVFPSRILDGLFYSGMHHIQELGFQLWLAVSQFKYTDGQIKASSDLFASFVCAYVPLGGVKRGPSVWHSVTYCARIWCEWHREWKGFYHKTLTCVKQARSIKTRCHI